jgi:heat shock protein HtpX
MINALGRLGQMQAGALPSERCGQPGITGDLSKLFASHPPLEERIAYLQQKV